MNERNLSRVANARPDIDNDNNKQQSCSRGVQWKVDILARKHIIAAPAYRRRSHRLPSRSLLRIRTCWWHAKVGRARTRGEGTKRERGSNERAGTFVILENWKLDCHKRQSSFSCGWRSIFVRFAVTRRVSLCIDRVVARCHAREEPGLDPRGPRPCAAPAVALRCTRASAFYPERDLSSASLFFSSFCAAAARMRTRVRFFGLCD